MCNWLYPINWAINEPNKLRQIETIIHEETNLQYYYLINTLIVKGKNSIIQLSIKTPHQYIIQKICAIIST